MKEIVQQKQQDGLSYKMANPFKLDMYLSQQTESLFAELQNVVCADIDFSSCLPEQARQKLYLGQICGIDFATSRSDEYRYLATFSLAGQAVPSGYYRSVLVTPAKGGLASLDTFSAERHLVAINEAGSFSGAVTFSRRMLGRGKDRFPHHHITGSHAASLGCIARADAMLASIDCLSFQMVLRQSPELKHHIKVLGYTDPFPGLPFVTSAQMPDDVCTLMTKRLLRFITGDRAKLWTDRLGVVSIIELSADVYHQMRSV